MTTATSRLNRLPAAERGITIADFLVPITIGERISTRMRHIALIVAGALLVALSANVVLQVPGSPVPISGQTFAVLLVGGALGGRRGVAAMLTYLAMGLFLPVYADHRQGLAVIGSWGRDGGGLVLGATGGYLVGFVLAAGLVGRLAELGWDRRFGGALLAMLVGNILIYLIGVPWLMAATGFDLPTAVAKGFVPFIAGDALKLALAAGIFPFSWWVVGRGTDER
jgi:biotin transport system substrate-specific component